MKMRQNEKQATMSMKTKYEESPRVCFYRDMRSAYNSCPARMYSSFAHALTTIQVTLKISLTIHNSFIYVHILQYPTLFFYWLGH